MIEDKWTERTKGESEAMTLSSCWSVRTRQLLSRLNNTTGQDNDRERVEIMREKSKTITKSNRKKCTEECETHFDRHNFSLKSPIPLPARDLPSSHSLLHYSPRLPQLRPSQSQTPSPALAKAFRSLLNFRVCSMHPSIDPPAPLVQFLHVPI